MSRAINQGASTPAASQAAYAKTDTKLTETKGRWRQRFPFDLFATTKITTRPRRHRRIRPTTGPGSIGVGDEDEDGTVSSCFIRSKGLSRGRGREDQVGKGKREDKKRSKRKDEIERETLT